MREEECSSRMPLSMATLHGEMEESGFKGRAAIESKSWLYLYGIGIKTKNSTRNWAHR